ncbi:hypothetical protein GCM10028790_56330 [Micromonospora taraxaci]
MQNAIATRNARAIAQNPRPCRRDPGMDTAGREDRVVDMAPLSLGPSIRANES